MAGTKVSSSCVLVSIFVLVGFASLFVSFSFFIIGSTKQSLIQTDIYKIIHFKGLADSVWEFATALKGYIFFIPAS